MTLRSILAYTVATAALWPTVVVAQTLCFISIDEGRKSPIRLQMTLPQDGSNVGSILYERGNRNIPIERVDERVASPGDTVPAIVIGRFKETLNSRVTGEYLLTTQGAAVGELTYAAVVGKKRYRFAEDRNASTDADCTWTTEQPTQKSQQSAR